MIIEFQFNNSIVRHHTSEIWNLIEKLKKNGLVQESRNLEKSLKNFLAEECLSNQLYPDINTAETYTFH